MSLCRWCVLAYVSRLMFTIFALATCGILWFLFKVNIEKGLFACIYAQNTKHLLLIVHPIVLYCH